MKTLPECGDLGAVLEKRTQKINPENKKVRKKAKK